MSSVQMVDAIMVRGVMRDWRQRNPANMYTLMALSTGVDFSVILAIANGFAKQVETRHAAAILSYLEEPLNTQMTNALREWKRRRAGK